MSRRVLVLRAAEGASALGAALQALGLDPVLAPAIEIAPPGDPGAFQEVFGKLASFDWLLFTSAHGASAFAASREALAEPVGLPAALRVAVIGKATAEAARTAGLRVDLMPPLAVAESLAEALADYALQPDGRPTRMLLVRAEEGREILPERLRAEGAEVTVVAAYRNVLPAASVQLLRRVLSANQHPPEAITFTSASTVRNLLALCAAAEVCLPEQALRISIGPVTSEALRAEGLPPHAEAREATVPSLARTVLEALETKDRVLPKA